VFAASVLVTTLNVISAAGSPLSLIQLGVDAVKGLFVEPPNLAVIGLVPETSYVNVASPQPEIVGEALPYTLQNGSATVIVSPGLRSTVAVKPNETAVWALAMGTATAIDVANRLGIGVAVEAVMGVAAKENVLAPAIVAASVRST